MRSYFALIGLCPSSLGQPTAKIVGPSKHRGEMAVRSSAGSVGDNPTLIKPDGPTNA